MTPLKGADNMVYAVAQGAVLTNAKVDRSLQQYYK